MEQNPNQVLIILEPDGRLQVSGCIDNKILALGMIELAKNVIANRQVSPIIKPVLKLS